MDSASGGLRVKTIYLLRHAKSSWDDASLPDFHRPLAPRGRKAAPRVGDYMARHGLLPDRVLCSAARRAVETWQALSPVLGENTAVEFREDIYHASPGNLLDAVRSLPPEVESVLLIGHNPTFEDLALALAGSGEEKALQELDRKYPTGAMAILDFPVQDWGEVREGTGWLRAFVRPRDLK
jgi:phosphohistidine phosphatase